MEEKLTHTITVDKNRNGKQKQVQEVKMIDFDMPFFSMVIFMIKWALASIPAIMIICIFCILIGIILISLFGTIVVNSFS